MSGGPADGVPAATPKPVKANYELAGRWSSAKVGKLVFDVAVTPHWMDSGDRFWYSFENSSGRKFYIVDPAKKSRAMVFDPARLATSLTTATGLPYDSQHLPITVIRFVKNEASIQFEVNVPRDATIPGEKKPTGAAAATTDGAANQQQEDVANEPQPQLGGRGGSRNRRASRKKIGRARPARPRTAPAPACRRATSPGRAIRRSSPSCAAIRLRFPTCG